MCRFDLCYLDRLDAFAGICGDGAVVDTCAGIDLNDDARNQFLHAFRLSRLISFLVKLAAPTAAPLGQFPEGWTRLTITLHEAFVHDGLLQVDTFLGRISTSRIASHATHNRLLRAAPA